jgi:acylphosphatase
LTYVVSAAKDEARIARVIVEGRVQNVGYRVFVAREAGRLHLVGWVRNRRDGSIETLVSGPPRAVEEFLSLAAIGPTTAHVESVRIEEADAHALSEGGGDGGFVAAGALKLPSFARRRRAD